MLVKTFTLKLRHASDETFAFYGNNEKLKLCFVYNKLSRAQTLYRAFLIVMAIF